MPLPAAVSSRPTRVLEYLLLERYSRTGLLEYLLLERYYRTGLLEYLLAATHSLPRTLVLLFAAPSLRLHDLVLVEPERRHRAVALTHASPELLLKHPIPRIHFFYTIAPC